MPRVARSCHFRLCLVVAATIACSGCVAGDEQDGGRVGLDGGSPLTCEQAALRWAEEMDRVAGDVSCAQHAECARIEATLECASGARLATCGLAVRADDAEAATGRLDAVRAEVCSAAPPGCSAASHCPAAPIAQCVDGHCQIQ